MERFIQARPGIDLGLGFNVLTGEVRGVAVSGDIDTSSADGQGVKANTVVVESYEQMMESLKVSVEASGHYGLFSAEGRFGLAQESSYTAQSTYVVASCTVENAFRSFARPTLLPEAAQRMRDDGPEAFKTGYGDAFVRGMRTGGELYAVFQLTSTIREEQNTVASSLQAELQGLLAGGSLQASVEHLKQTKAQVSQMSALFYQRAGQDSSISPVTSPEEIARRLKDFPTIARAAPVGYLAQIIDYQVLALPPFDEVGFRQRMEALEDYARLKMKFYGMCADIDLVRRNPTLFFPDYQDKVLASAYDLYIRAINRLNEHARRVASKEIAPDLFDAAAYDPELKELPIFTFRKKAPESDMVQVPAMLGLAVDTAKGLLQSQGLNPTSNAVGVPFGSDAPTNVITGQAPEAGTSASKGTNVVIDYNYVALERFNWAQGARAEREIGKPFRVI